MESLYILIPLSVVLVFVIAAIFWWSVRSGQYDDMEGPAYRMLLDDRDAPEPSDRTSDAGGEGASSGDEGPAAGQDDAGARKIER